MFHEYLSESKIFGKKVGPDLGPKCLQMLSADTTSRYSEQLQFQETDMSPGKTEVKQGKCRIYIPGEGLF